MIKDKYTVKAIPASETYEWLLKNAGKFGFCQAYSERGQNRKFGYEEEKWHWSYLPLAQSYTKDYPILIKKEDIGGFSGCESFERLSVIHHFVLGINPSCKCNNFYRDIHPL